MKVEVAKKQLIKQLVISLVLIAVSGGIIYVANTYKEAKKTEVEDMKKEEQRIISKHSANQKDFNSLKENFEFYKNLPTYKKLSETGLQQNSERIRAARTVLEKLQKKYYIEDLKISLAPIEEQTFREQGYSFKTIVAYENTLNLDFKSYTDELAVSFLKDFSKEINGGVMFNTLNLSRDISVNTSADITTQIKAAVQIKWLILQEKT